MRVPPLLRQQHSSDALGLHHQAGSTKPLSLLHLISSLIHEWIAGGGRAWQGEIMLDFPEPFRASTKKAECGQNLSFYGSITVSVRRNEMLGASHLAVHIITQKSKSLELLL